MIVEYTESATFEENTIHAKRIVIQDNDGNRYRIRPDITGGIEVMAEDGKMVIEPNMSNVVTLKTLP
jgi:hypothetical protein